ncbi:hypothetical protein ACTXT7_000532 [Hymenolepis weldensis]
MDLFTANDFAFARDFRVCHFWKAGTVIKRRIKVYVKSRLRIAEPDRSQHQPYFTSCWSVANFHRIHRIRPKEELQDNRYAICKGVVESPEHFR